MVTTDDIDSAETFSAERSGLLRLAYRMTGTLQDAEDIVQDAWFRWQAIESGTVNNAPAYLKKIVINLSLDCLRQRRRRSVAYTGEWLPEPAFDGQLGEPGLPLERDVSFALLVALERLSPLERATFILKDIFDIPFSEIAALLDRKEAACRQLAKRARANLVDSAPRFTASSAEHEAIATAFFRASREGDERALMRQLAEDVALHSDGGGQRLAALNPIIGTSKVTRFYCGLARKASTNPLAQWREVRLNGHFAELAVDAKDTLQATIVGFSAKGVSSIYLLRNPDKIAHLWRTAPLPRRKTSPPTWTS